MMEKVLFLNRKSATEFYNNERNKYPNVTATNIFRRTGPLGHLLRKSLATLRLPGLSFFLNDWKHHIADYDLFILSASRYSREIAKYIREKSDKKIIHWYWNPVSTTDVKPDKIRGYDCEFFSFDRDDCNRYGLHYTSTYYFSTIRLPENEITNDIYFLGADKGRLNQLLELKKIFEEQGLKVEFHIVKSSNSPKTENYVFQPEVPYTKVLEGISKCRAILDYLQAGQAGMSQRPMEALFHKKKLITNDIDIDKSDFYHKNNIFILGKDDIGSLKEFMNSPYIDMDNKIVEKYDFENWLKQLQ